MNVYELVEARYDEDQAEELMESIHDGFSQDASFLQYLKQLQERKGVQVIYGDKPTVTNFIEEQDYRPDDDNGVRIYKPVPPGLILAIAPLGAYEQRILKA